MRRFSFALVVILVVLAGTSGRRASSAPESVTTFRVATFNIHKGAHRQGDYDLERTIEAIPAPRRRPRRHAGGDAQSPGFSCDDQAALIAEGLRRRTGRPGHMFVRRRGSRKTGNVGRRPRIRRRHRRPGVSFGEPDSRIELRPPVRGTGGIGRARRSDAASACHRDAPGSEPRKSTRSDP